MNKLVYSYLFCFLLSGYFCYGQNFTWKFQIKDTSGSPLAYCSVMILQEKDSFLLQYKITNELGNVEFNNIPKGSYIIHLALSNFEDESKIIEIKENLVTEIILNSIPKLLDAIEIKAEASPMKVEKDTIQYNAAAFKTQVGDNVETLLKKLPGIEVKKDGSIKAYGEDVKNVLVDGKEFFGKDTRIATKNLEADAVDKVQVFDKKSEMAEFTGVEDGQKERSINLKLKEGKKKAYFGNSELALGTEKRFHFKSNLNRFKPGQRLSLIATANNINEQGFSIQDYIEFMGGLSAFANGSGGIKIELNGDEGIPLQEDVAGIQRSLGTGLNFNKDFSKNTEISCNYFFSKLNNITITDLYAENYLPNQNFLTKENYTIHSNSQSHLFSLNLKHKIDSFHQLGLVLNSRIVSNQKLLFSFSQAFNEMMNIINDGTQENNFTNDKNNFGGKFIFQKRFRKKGRSAVTQLQANISPSINSGYIKNIRGAYLGLINTDTVQQEHKANEESLDFSATIAYTEPLSRRCYIQYNGSYSNLHNVAIKEYYDIYPRGHKNFNVGLSDSYQRDYTQFSHGPKLIFHHRKSNFTSGINIQFSKQLGSSEKIIGISNYSYKSYLPYIFATHEFTSGHNINFDYTTQLREPSIKQLQPIVDNTDPIHIYTGNPELQVEYHHQINASYLKYDAFTFSSLFARFYATYVSHKINNNTILDSNYFSYTKPVNTNNETSIGASLNYNRPIRPLKIIVDIGYRNTFSKSQIFINNTENILEKWQHNIRFQTENRKKAKLDLIVSYKISINNSKYSIQKNLGNTYIDQLISGESLWNINSHCGIKFSCEQKLYGRTAFYNSKNFLLVNMEFYQYFLKLQRLKVFVNVHDMLNQDQGIANYIQENQYTSSKNNVLGRYFLIGCYYSIRGFNNKKNNTVEFKVDR